MEKLGLKFLFWKCISSHTHACLFLIFNVLSFKKLGYFFKKMFFPDFRFIQFDFRSIEILLKNFSKPLPGSIDQIYFSINRTSWIKFFFLKQCLSHSKHFFKSFSNFPLSLRLGKAPLRIFCRFQPNFCKVFLSQGR